jgi:hypothetical protein
MLIAPLPFDYVTLLDHGDRIRRARKITTDRRVRTPAPDPRRSR